MSDENQLAVQAVSGQDVLRYVDDLARLRIEVFREYPYLYDGDPAYEKQYLATYADAPASVFVVASCGGRVVGVSTGTPLKVESPDVRRPFEVRGWPVDDVFYFGESVLEPAYRGRGAGHRFFEERESHARRHGFRWAAFCGVDRAADDPRRPAGFRPLDPFWRRRGYERQDEMQAVISWKQIGESVSTPKTLTFWTRRLEA